MSSLSLDKDLPLLACSQRTFPLDYGLSSSAFLLFFLANVFSSTVSFPESSISHALKDTSEFRPAVARLAPSAVKTVVLLKDLPPPHTTPPHPLHLDFFHLDG